MADTTKVGIIACSGEEIPAGTVSRLATRRVLELLRPQSTVTLCLPLFLAGEEQERRFARQHPTITVDGCEKLCAKRGTEQYSGQVAASLVVAEILGDRLSKCHCSARDFDKADEEAVWLVAERIAAEVDSLAAAVPESPQVADTPQRTSCGCSCGTQPVEGDLILNGRTVTVNGLPRIFDHLRKSGLTPGNRCADRLLETVRIYHAIEPHEESAYRDALVAAYQMFCTAEGSVEAMKTSRIVSRAMWVMVVGSAAILAGGALGQETQPSKTAEQAAAMPSHRVVAVYFHRTVRCPTCKKIGAYIEQAVQTGYAQELKDCRVQFTLIDFQDPKNAQFTSYYRISGPTLVIMDVRDNKVKTWKPAPQVWALVADPDAFFKYVQDEVRSYLEAK